MKVALELPFVPPLSVQQLNLLELLLVAHQRATCDNQNASRQVAFVATKGSGRFSQGAAAGILTIGLRHAPIGAAREVLSWTSADISEAIRHGKIVPGWGNSFHRDGIDPAFMPVWDALHASWPAMTAWIAHHTNLFHGLGKRVYPNAALLTAAVCEICEIPTGIEEALFIVARVPVWAAECA
jgi:citrate synthase